MQDYKVGLEADRARRLGQANEKEKKEKRSSKKKKRKSSSSKDKKVSKLNEYIC